MTQDGRGSAPSTRSVCEAKRRAVVRSPWRWHSRILRELAFTHGDLEHHREKVLFIERYNEIYDPDMIAEQSWPLMKMGKFDEARAAARMGLADGSPRQTEVALNALCAIEFEAGNDDAQQQYLESYTPGG